MIKGHKVRRQIIYKSKKRQKKIVSSALHAHNKEVMRKLGNN